MLTCFLHIVQSVTGDNALNFITEERNPESGSITVTRLVNLNLYNWLDSRQIEAVNEIYEKTGNLAITLNLAYDFFLDTDGYLREKV